MTPSRLLTAGLLIFFAISALGAPARAQGAPQIQAELDQSTVGVGDVVHLEMNATSADVMPSDPRPGATPGFVVRAQSTSPSQTHISINGSRMDRYTLGVEWALQAQRVGAFTVGPPSVVVGGARYASRPLTVRVVPAGQAPLRRSQPSPPSPIPFGLSPFDPWKGLIQLRPSDLEPRSQPEVALDPRYALDAPRGAVYFLHATSDKTSAVVGEQVTYSLYEYIDAAEGSIQVNEEDVHDPQTADFVRHSLVPEDQGALLAGYASAGGRTWIVKLVRRWALFPLHPGDLSMGPMSVGLLRPQSVAGQRRTTETLHVRVSEPPTAGRPPGYAPGDVGHFALTAQVEPRSIEQRAAVSVHVEVTGTGNVPSAITAPARDGIEWLAPEVHEKLGPVGSDAYGGKRTFDFVVRVKQAGDVDLGQIALPFWDPHQRKYDVARAALGVVHVAALPVDSSRAPSERAEELLPGLPPPRGTLEGLRAAPGHADDSRLFWLAGVGAWPIALGAAVAGRAVTRRAGDALRRRRTSPVAELKERVHAARVACHGEDPRTVDAAVARALEAATVAHAGVSVRGAVGEEVAERLARAGVVPGAASQVAEILRECEAARFAPDAVDVAAAKGRWLRAQGAIRQLEKRG